MQKCFAGVDKKVHPLKALSFEDLSAPVCFLFDCMLHPLFTLSQSTDCANLLKISPFDLPYPLEKCHIKAITFFILCIFLPFSLLLGLIRFGAIRNIAYILSSLSQFPKFLVIIKNA